MNAIVLVIDRLQAGYLGCYGNSWIATPAVDCLAGESFVFDLAIIDSPHLDLLCRSFWTGRHAMAPANPQLDVGGWPALLSQQGVATTLLTDEPHVAGHSLARHFGQVIQPPLQATTKSADDVSQTQLARIFAAASDWLSTATEPFCLWLHSRGMSAAWDAPLAFRERYADDEGPPLPQFVDPPSRRLPEDADPDELLGLRWAYAGQVSLLDACLGEFLALIDTPELRGNTLLGLVSARGYPLGEHRVVGDGQRDSGQPRSAASESPLHEELVHAAWLLRFPAGLGAAVRSQALVQPGDLAATLCSWWDLPAPVASGADLLPIVRDQAETVRDRAAIYASSSERALRTPAWHLRLSSGTTPAETRLSRRLYAKPGDRWEMNEVSDRCGDVPEMLTQALADFEQAQQHSPPPALPPLPEVLIEGLE